MSAQASDQLQLEIDALASTLSADFFLVNSGIADKCGDKFLSLIRSIPNRRSNASMVLITRGGSADSAFQMARSIKRHYQKFTLYVFGYCKSAGTLLAVGADEIVMSEFGQLGPLDVQLADKKEMFGQTPALDVSQALATLSDSAFNFFTNQLFEMEPGRGISTNTAVDIAKSLTLGIIEPIAKQIDPLLLGQVERSMRIAKAYCTRLNPKFANIKKLSEDYPSHEFVIDFQEAKTLFNNVREPTAEETSIENLLRTIGVAPFQENRSVVKILSTNSPLPILTETEKTDEKEAPNGGEVKHLSRIGSKPRRG
jgi:Serine dehydrogenase proteinase